MHRRKFDPTWEFSPIFPKSPQNLRKLSSQIARIFIVLTHRNAAALKNISAMLFFCREALFCGENLIVCLLLHRWSLSNEGASENVAD